MVSRDNTVLRAMDYRIQYQKFVDAVMDGFDENAEPDDQIAAAERFDRIRACFLAGDPMRTDEAELQALVLEFSKIARIVSADLLRDVDKGLLSLSEYCIFKRHAIRHRKARRLAIAEVFEAYCEKRYDNLPKAFR